jgi:hypothetical protein
MAARGKTAGARCLDDHPMSAHKSAKKGDFYFLLALLNKDFPRASA